MPCYQANGAKSNSKLVVVVDRSSSMVNEIPHIRPVLIKHDIRSCIAFGDTCTQVDTARLSTYGNTYMAGVPDMLMGAMTEGCTVVIITDGALTDPIQTKRAFDAMPINVSYSLVFIQITTNEVLGAELATFIKNATTVSTIRIPHWNVQSQFESAFSFNVGSVSINEIGTTSIFTQEAHIQSLPDGTIFHSNNPDMKFPRALPSEITQFVDNSVRRALMGGMSFESVSQVVNDFAMQYSEKIATKIKNVLSRVATECGNTLRIQEYLKKHGSSFLANGLQRKIAKRAIGNTVFESLMSPLNPTITDPRQQSCVVSMRNAQELVEEILETRKDPLPENYAEVFRQLSLFGIALNRQSQDTIGQNPFNILLKGGVSCLPHFTTTTGFTHQGEEYSLQFPLCKFNQFVGNDHFVRAVQDMAAGMILYNDPAIIIPKSRSAVLFAIIIDLISHHEYSTDFISDLIDKLKAELRSNIGQTSITAVMETDTWVNGTEQLHPLEVLAILTIMNAGQEKFDAWLRYQILRSSKSDTNIITFPNIPYVSYDTDFTQVPMPQPTYADYYHIHSQNRRSTIELFTRCAQYVGININDLDDRIQTIYRQQSYSSVDDHARTVYNGLLRDAIILARVNRSNDMLRRMISNDSYDLNSVHFTFQMAKDAIRYAIEINNFELFCIVSGLIPVDGFTTDFTKAHFRSYGAFVSQHDMNIYTAYCSTYQYRPKERGGQSVHNNEFPSYFIYNCYNMTEFIAFCHDKPDLLADYQNKHRNCTCIKENYNSSLCTRAKIRIGLI